MEDKLIIGMYLNRNENAIKETDVKYGHSLRIISKNITENECDAEECVNDTYYKAWNSIPPTQPVCFFAYLAKIVRNISFNLIERNKAAKRNAIMVELSIELEECIASPSEESTSEAVNVSEAISTFLEMQSKKARFMFVRRYFDCEQIAEIASSEGMTENAVSATLFRMRRKLKTYLEKEGLV